MKVRVGIDLDDNNWVDWAGNNPLNLIPNALRFNALSVDETYNVTIYDRMEQNPYGLIIRKLSATSSIFPCLGLCVSQPLEVQPLTTYTLVVWARKITPDAAGLILQVAEPSFSTFYQGSSVLPVGSDWTRLSYVFTTPIDVNQLAIRIVHAPNQPDADYELTGLGLYMGNQPTVTFNSGSQLGHLEDISDYVLSVRFDSGSNSDITNMTPIDGQLEVILRNDDRAWSPRNEDSPYHGLLQPQTIVEVRASIDDVQWEVLWTGFYDGMTLSVGVARDRQATLKAVQGLLYMDNERVRYRPKTNQTTTQILTDILPQTVIPANRFTWRLGRGRLGIDTAFPDISAFTDLDETEYVHSIAGVGLDDKTTVRTFLNDLVRNEGGFAFYDRVGRLVFRSRDRLFPSIYDVD